MVAALLLGGVEKLDGVPDYGVPLEHVDGDPAAAWSRPRGATARSGSSTSATSRCSTSATRFRLIAHALAAGLEYTGADFAFRPPPRPDAGRPGAGGGGDGEADREDRRQRPRGPPALGRPPRRRRRDGPGRPGGAGGRRRRRGPRRRRRPARALPAGAHAASDYLEDAALAGVVTVGARRCGWGLAGAPFLSNVAEAVAAARALAPDLVSSRDRARPFRRWRRTARCW